MLVSWYTEIKSEWFSFVLPQSSFLHTLWFIAVKIFPFNTFFFRRVLEGGGGENHRNQPWHLTYITPVPAPSPNRMQVPLSLVLKTHKRGNWTIEQINKSSYPLRDKQLTANPAQTHYKLQWYHRTKDFYCIRGLFVLSYLCQKFDINKFCSVTKYMKQRCMTCIHTN